MSVSPFTRPPLFFFTSKSPFSNFNRRRFTVDGVLFDHMEQYLMYCKALYFADLQVAKLVLREPDPVVCKRLGRSVRPFNAEKWDIAVWNIALKGMHAKYTQNKDYLALLLESAGRELVEASPYDYVWGIGIDINDPRIHDRSQWGNNKQGKLTMKTREALIAESFCK